MSFLFHSRAPSNWCSIIAAPADEPIWADYPQRRHLLPKIKNVVECLRQELGDAVNSS
ncbi:MAG: hypothetical protein QHC40_07010 [Sphingobium sp.]|nr:hypothetical protein [Sphingobium sp.]